MNDTLPAGDGPRKDDKAPDRLAGPCAPLGLRGGEPSGSDEELAGWQSHRPSGETPDNPSTQPRTACVCGEIVDELPLAQSTVSEHLRILKEAGLVRGESMAPACVIAWSRATGSSQDTDRCALTRSISRSEPKGASPLESPEIPRSLPDPLDLPGHGYRGGGGLRVAADRQGHPECLYRDHLHPHRRRASSP